MLKTTCSRVQPILIYKSHNNFTDISKQPAHRVKKLLIGTSMMIQADNSIKYTVEGEGGVQVKCRPEFL